MFLLGKVFLMGALGGVPHAGDEALRAPVIQYHPGPEYGDENRLFQGIPGIERAPRGRLWATWYAGGDNEGPANYVVLVTSADDGMTWSAPVLVIDPEGDVRAFDPCLWVDPDGRLWLFWAQAYGHWDGRAGVWAMVAEEPDRQEPGWSSPRRLWDGIMMNKPLELSSGEWALPVAIWSLTPTISGPQVRDLADRSGSLMVVSTDRGTNWGLRGKSAVPQRSCDEHHIVELKDGRLWMLVRTEYGIGDSYSSDRGRTWDPGGQSHITHIPHARFFIRRLASGRLLLVKHDPPDRNTRSHLTAFLSEDEGQTWQGGLLLDKRRGVSYPDGVQGPDGTIYVIYDYSRRSEKKILLTTFSESDVLMGAYRSPVARQRLLVNQATGR